MKPEATERNPPEALQIQWREGAQIPENLGREWHGLPSFVQWKGEAPCHKKCFKNYEEQLASQKSWKHLIMNFAITRQTKQLG